MPIEVDEQNTYILLGKYTINSPLPPIEIYTKPLPSSPIRAVNYIIYGILFVIITTCDLVFYGMFINRYLGAVLCAYAAIFVVTLLTFYAIAQRRQYCLIIATVCRGSYLLLVTMALGIAAFIWVVFLLSDNAFIDSPYFTDGLLLGILSVLYIFLSIIYIQFSIRIAMYSPTKILKNIPPTGENLEMFSYEVPHV